MAENKTVYTFESSSEKTRFGTDLIISHCMNISPYGMQVSSADDIIKLYESSRSEMAEGLQKHFLNCERKDHQDLMYITMVCNVEQKKERKDFLSDIWPPTFEQREYSSRQIWISTKGYIIRRLDVACREMLSEFMLDKMKSENTFNRFVGLHVLITHIVECKLAEHNFKI